MADVRALLRAERVARGVDEKSKKHAHRFLPPATQSRKRKADEPPEEETRKRAKSKPANGAGDALQAESTDSAPLTDHSPGPAPIEAQVDEHASAGKHSVIAPASNLDQSPEDDPEFAAFLQEMDEQQVSIKPYGAFSEGNGTISGRAMTAEELELKRQEDMSTQRSMRDEDLENDKDDAARLLSEEFNQVQEMESRVSRLRAMREKVRMNQDQREEQIAEETVQDKIDEDLWEEDDDEDDEWNVWTFSSA